MAFGKAIGFVREGTDVGGLIQAFHNMAPLAGLVGALPWLMNPILQNPILGRFFMPKAGDGTGTGKIMQVDKAPKEMYSRASHADTFQYRDNMLEHRLKNRHSDYHGDFLSK